MAEPASGDELYGLDPDQFTSARAALAKERRAEGHREDAARVAKLRKPPVTAWALNMVARAQPDLVAELLAAGHALRDAMERAVGGDASAMREAQVAERRAVDAVIGAGAAHLERAGRPSGDAARKRMAGTLRAAVVDPSTASKLRNGVLDTDMDAPGFGLDALSVVAPSRPATPSTATRDDRAGGGSEGGGKTAAPTQRGSADARGRQDAARDEEEEDRTRARLLRAEADEAEQRAREAERASVAAERRAQDLRAEADDARAEADRLVRRAEELAAEAAEAEDRASGERVAARDAAARAVEARQRAGPPG